MSSPKSTSKLLDFVDLYELTKHISLHASNVELMSMNALIANKSAGTHSGFSAVAENLRVFSIDVIEKTRQLSLEFNKIISSITIESNLYRRARIINDTQEKSARASSCISSTTDSIKRYLAISARDFNKVIVKVSHLLNTINSSCLVGSGLSVSGKIESTYLGELGAMVYSISNDIWIIVNSIFNILSDIKDRVNGHSS